MKSGKNTSTGKIMNQFKKCCKISKTLKLKTDSIKVKTSQWASFWVSWIIITGDNFITGTHLFQNKYITVLMKATKKKHQNNCKERRLIL